MAAPPSTIANELPPNFDHLKPATPHTFNPSTDMSAQTGKVFLITGGNAGIGKQTALELAKHYPAQIWILARNAETGKLSVKEINAVAPEVDVRFVDCDLASFTSIKSAARTVLKEATKLDVLLLNAGIVS